MTHLKTKAEQRLEQLCNCGRPLTETESDELYRALHADYQRKWRQRKAAAAGREMGKFAMTEVRKHEARTLAKVRQELAG